VLHCDGLELTIPTVRLQTLDNHIVLFCSLAVLDPRVGHTMDVLSPFISILCPSDCLFHRESCPRLDVVYPGRAWSSILVMINLLSLSKAVFWAWGLSFVQRLLGNCWVRPTDAVFWYVHPKIHERMVVMTAYAAENSILFRTKISSKNSIWSCVHLTDTRVCWLVG